MTQHGSEIPAFLDIPSGQPFSEDPNVNAFYAHQRMAVDSLRQAIVDMHAIKDQQIAELRYQATHDSLTGLLNKAAWKQTLEARMVEGKKTGVGLIDLDYFKRVNDVLGHEEGDALLARFGTFMSNRFQRESDALTHERLINSPRLSGGNEIGRYGGDEFAITYDLSDGDFEPDENHPFNDRRRPANTEDRMQIEAIYMNEILQEFVASQPEQIRELGFNVSFGYATWDPERDGQVDASELIRQADASMYVAKGSRRDPRS